MRRNVPAVKIIMGYVREEEPLLGRGGGGQQRLAVRRRDGGVELAVEDKDRRLDAGDFTDGIEMIIVVVWKNALMVVPMPVMYMWCAQTMKDMKPRKITEKTIVR